MFALAAPRPEDQDEDEDHAGEPRSSLDQPISFPFHHSRPPLRRNLPDSIQNLRSAIFATGKACVDPVVDTLLTVKLPLLLATGPAQIPEPPDPPDPPDPVRQGSVWFLCSCYHLCVMFTGDQSKSQYLSPPPRPASAISAGKELYSGMNFKTSRNFPRHLNADVLYYHVLGMIRFVLFLLDEKEFFGCSVLKERSSSHLFTDELKFSEFSNSVTLTTWLWSESLNCYAILSNIGVSFVDFLYVLEYMSRDLLISFLCCPQRISLRLLKVFPDSNPRNPSSFMDRGLLSSVLRNLPLTVTVLVVSLRASYDHGKVLGVKKAHVMFVSLQMSTSRSLVDGDLVVDSLIDGCISSKASDKASSVLLIGCSRFGSLIITRDGTFGLYVLCFYQVVVFSLCFLVLLSCRIIRVRIGTILLCGV